MKRRTASAKQTVLFAALAAEYFPRCSTRKNAVRCLNRWIKECAPLTSELAGTGYRSYNHRRLSREQYLIITKHLGFPFSE